MSSAALQSAHHQQPALASPSLASPSGHQYTSSHPPQSREAYHAQQAAAASPSSRRPSSRKNDANGASNSFDPNSPLIARHPPGNNAAFAGEHQSPSSERASAMPPVAPPRTSSSQQATSRRSNYPNDAMNNSPRHGPADSPRSGSRGGTNGGPEQHKSKRPANSYPAQDSPARSAAGRDARGPEVSMPIRTQQPATSRSSREASESLNRAISNAGDTNGHDSRSRHHVPSTQQDDAAPPPVVGTGAAPSDDRRGGRSRHDHSRGHKGTSKFGDFILGNTIGEGEFGKVKLGWKQDSSVQVAIKLIKRDSVGSNPSRLAKIRREVTILRGIQHPNIVQLIDMVETDRYIGIILEYASGGELFDYILNHRYLKDHSARRLFSQLISGVGYLHKKGIVHRDLKLENLLLDRNRNIIITDFGFANTFDANDELSEEEEFNLTDRDNVKRMGLDIVKSNGTRKGDLMQTSCGSPCYAAPELVVSDSLYTGRKVDVWSCGVILYAMLAGYLPFDDDPANPEGDNINLLYKYIVTTPLTFPEYVTPHARDLLRRILVPNPRKRADLFEVARHSWLSEYSHVVEFITSSTTLPSDVQNPSAPVLGYAEPPMVARSSSVREAAKQKTANSPYVGGLAKAHGKIDQDAEPAQRTPKDTKRRTVQVEYVAPITQTQRGADAGLARQQHRTASRDRVDGQHMSSAQDKPLPRDPPVSRDAYARSGQSKPPLSGQMAPPPRPSRDARAITDNAYMTNAGAGGRPQTGGSMQSATSTGLQSRGSYGQPAPPTIADTNVEGRIQQPASADGEESMGRPSVGVPPKFAKMAAFNEGRAGEFRGHKRSSTIGDISSKLLGRSGSMFGRKKRPEQMSEKPKKYPPVSMSNAMATGDEPASRPSMDSKFSRRSFSLGLGKKRSGSIAGSQGSGDKKDKDRRRFSLLPASFSLKSIGLGKDSDSSPPSDMGSHHDLPMHQQRMEQPRSVTAPEDARGSSPFFDRVYDKNQQHDTANSSPVYHQRYVSEQMNNRKPNAVPSYMRSGGHAHSGSESSIDMRRPPTEPAMGSRYDYTDSEDGRRAATSRGSRGVLQKNHKRFTDAYDQSDYRGHEGSSGAAKRVMDFFRRRGKARGGDDR